jgi:hypothetical protein
MNAGIRVEVRSHTMAKLIKPDRGNREQCVATLWKRLRLEAAVTADTGLQLVWLAEDLKLRKTPQVALMAQRQAQHWLYKWCSRAGIAPTILIGHSPGLSHTSIGEVKFSVSFVKPKAGRMIPGTIRFTSCLNGRDSPLRPGRNGLPNGSRPTCTASA